LREWTAPNTGGLRAAFTIEKSAKLAQKEADELAGMIGKMAKRLSE
jgi:hypothetical protein